MRVPAPPLLLVLALLLLVAPACHSVPSAQTPRPPPGPDVPTPEYYESPGPVPQATSVELEWRQERNELWRVLLPPRIAPAVAHVRGVEDPIEILFLRPRPVSAQPRPLVFMFPILANKELLMYEIGSGFNRQGYDVALVLRKEIDFDPVRSLDDAEAEARTMIMRGRQAIDWLALQPGVDATRIGVFGLSAGGILGACLAAADPRIRAQVLVLAGGPMADVMVATTEDTIAKRIARIEAERGWSKERVRDTLRGALRTDPIVLAPRIAREDTLMFIASGDESVPTHTQEALWEALGRPRAHRIFGGHYAGIALHLPLIVSRAQRFLGQRLGAP